MDPSGKSVFDVIVEEHRVVDQLYQQFLGSSDLHEKQAIAHNVIKLLSQHAACEEMALYPVIKLKLPNGAQMVQQALQEHLLVKRELFDIDSMLVGQSGYDDKFSQCLNDLLLHVKEEEEQVSQPDKHTLSSAITAARLLTAPCALCVCPCSCCLPWLRPARLRRCRR